MKPAQALVALAALRRFGMLGLRVSYSSGITGLSFYSMESFEAMNVPEVF